MIFIIFSLAICCSSVSGQVEVPTIYDNLNSKQTYYPFPIHENKDDSHQKSWPEPAPLVSNNDLDPESQTVSSMKPCNKHKSVMIPDILKQADVMNSVEKETIYSALKKDDLKISDQILPTGLPPISSRSNKKSQNRRSEYEPSILENYTVKKRVFVTSTTKYPNWTHAHKCDTNINEENVNRNENLEKSRNNNEDPDMVIFNNPKNEEQISVQVDAISESTNRRNMNNPTSNSAKQKYYNNNIRSGSTVPLQDEISDQNKDCAENSPLDSKTDNNPDVNIINSRKSNQENVLIQPQDGFRQKVMLMENTRVCYACSSANNPSCLDPNRFTTVKYCLKGHDSCVTKIFQGKESSILVRDCGNSCSDGVLPGLTPKYSKCSVCHTDLCNGSYSINAHNIILICFMMLFIIVESSL